MTQDAKKQAAAMHEATDIGTKLTAKQLECLRQLMRTEEAIDEPPTSAEVSRLAGHADYWARPALKRLEEMDLAMQSRNFRWLLRPTGRSLLRSLQEKSHG